MHAALSEAVTAVRRDQPPGSHEDLLATAVEHRRWWLQEWEAGAPYVLGLLAQDLQEAVHATDPTWPVCRESSCPQVGAHPLFVEPDLGSDPFWTCDKTGLPVAPVGRLTG